MSKEVTVIVVNYNTRDLVNALLTSLYASKENSTLEITVVDNGSTDRSVESIRQRFRDVRVISNCTNVGFGRANNQAAKLAELYALLAHERGKRREHQIPAKGLWGMPEASRPGTYEAMAVDRVSDILTRAGGLTNRGSERQIQVKHQDGTVDVVDLFRYKKPGGAGNHPAGEHGHQHLVDHEGHRGDQLSSPVTIMNLFSSQYEDSMRLEFHL